MPEKVVEVPGVGNIAFPDSMSDDAIADVLKKQTKPAAAQPQKAEQPGFFQRFGEAVNPVNIVQGFGRAIEGINNPGAAVADAVQGSARNYADNGNGARAVASSLPVVGTAAEDLSTGNTRGLAGTALGMAALPAAVKGVRAAAPAVRTAAEVVKANKTDALGAVSPRLAHIVNLWGEFSKLMHGEAPPAPAAPPAPPVAAAPIEQRLAVQYADAPPSASGRGPVRAPVSKAAVAPAIAEEPPAAAPQSPAAPSAAPAPAWNPDELPADPFKQTDAYQRGIDAMKARRRGAAPAPAPSKEVIQQPVPAVPEQGGTAPAAFMDSEATGTQGPATANRAAVASKMAQHFYDYGITSDEISQLEAHPDAWKSFWDQTGQIPGVSKQRNYRPSGDTIDAVRDQLQSLERSGTQRNPAQPAATSPEPTSGPLANNPKARGIAEQLQAEMAKGDGSPTNTVPESGATIETQISQLADGSRRVVLLPPGTDAPPIPKGMKTVQTKAGTAIYDPKQIGPGKIRVAALQDKLPEILGPSEGGMGAPPKSAIKGKAVTVVARDANGKEVQATVTDGPNLARTIRQTRKVTPKGGALRIEPAERVLRDRAQ